MTRFKKFLACALALSLVLCSMSIMASASSSWPTAYSDFGTSDKISYGIKTAFYDASGNPITRAAPGDSVKLRIWIITDYFSQSAQIAFCYPEGMFTSNYGINTPITANVTSGSFAATYSAIGDCSTNKNPYVEDDCIAEGYVDESFFDEYDYLVVKGKLTTSKLWNDPVNWTFELDLKVTENIDDVNSTGYVFVEESLIADPVDRPYAFTSLSKTINANAAGGDEFYDWSQSPKATLVAEPITFASTITFDANNGALDSAATTEFKGIINSDFGAMEPTPIAPDGMYFVGWNTDPDATTGVPDLSDVTYGYEDVTYYAIYDYNNVNINFNANNGTFAEGAVISFEKEPGTDLECPEVSRYGYEFLGWSTDVNATKGEIPAKVPDSDKTYFAVWKAGVFDAVFVLNGETYETVPTEFKQQINVPDNPTEPEGYKFSGWSPEVGLMDEEGKTFTATLAPVDCLVTFDLDGGNINGNEMDVTDTVKYDAVISAPDTPEKYGHNFGGWIDNDTDAVVTFAEGTPVMNNVSGKLYTAKWEVQEFTVTFIDYYGNVYDTATVGYNLAIPTPETDPSDIVASDDVHVVATFEGWKDVPTTMPASDIIVYADYKDVPVKLIPAADQTTVVDRNGYLETIADFDGVAGTDYIAYNDSSGDDQELWYIYGLGERLNESRLLSYVDYTGDGRIEIVPCTVFGGAAAGFGTGSVVNLYDANDTPDDLTDDTLVESFYAVVFGDVNGDARITNTDVTLADTEVAGASEVRWGRGQIPYRFKAGNINCDSRITNTDASAIASVVAGASKIDQATCEIS